MTIMGTIAASMSAFLVCAAEFDPVAFIEDSLARGEKTVGGCRVLYNSLNVPKSITWGQGHTHGWHPRGMASLTFKENKE